MILDPNSETQPEETEKEKYDKWWLSLHVLCRDGKTPFRDLSYILQS